MKKIHFITITSTHYLAFQATAYMADLIIFSLTGRCNYMPYLNR